MKKKITLLSTAVLAGLISFGQAGELPREGTSISADILNTLNHEAQERLTAEGTDREEVEAWVSFELNNYLNVYGEDQFFTYGQVISPDSVPQVGFTDGLFRSYTHGFGQMFDPTAEDLDLLEYNITAADSYEIDSIGFPCIYRRIDHNGIDDSLVITIAITDKTTEAGNPYDGAYVWGAGGLLPTDMNVMAPSYAGVMTDGYHYGLTGTSDGGANVEIQTYTFALTDADTDILWRSFPVDISAGPDQVVYTFVEFKPSFEAEAGDVAFVFDGGVGEATTNSFRTIYDYPIAPQTGYFFDLNRDDEFTYNASYVEDINSRYVLNEGDDSWRNDRVSVYSWWGFRFEYYMRATNSANVPEEDNVAFTIYPNPSSDYVEIQLNASVLDANASFQVTDLSGKMVYSQNGLNSNTLGFSAKALGLESGVYTITLNTGTSISMKKFIIQ